MMNDYYKFLILLALLNPVDALASDGWREHCKGVFAQTMAWLTPPEDLKPKLDKEEIEHLRAWLQWNYRPQPPVIYSLKRNIKLGAYLSLSSLNSRQREVLFSSVEQQKNLEKLFGVDLRKVPAVITINEDLELINQEQRVLFLESQIASIRFSEPEQLEASSRAWEHFLNRATITAKLRIREREEYQILFSRGEALFPDGGSAPVVKEVNKHKMLLEVPASRIISVDPITEFSHLIQTAQPQVNGDFLPDGQFLVDSPRDLINATYGFNRDFVIVTLKKKKTQKYFYTHTHFQTLEYFHYRDAHAFVDMQYANNLAFFAEQGILPPIRWLAPYYQRVMTGKNPHWEE